ncbi:MAG TPA: hypothetical protein VKV37_03245 [Ktedonobacteraceae bacterium]|jgi:hypothetical protein|nr:hypothetical protein [Ktedonobacteraceae bacterium]
MKHRQEDERMLSVWEAMTRTQGGVEEIEEIIDDFNGYRLEGEKREQRHNDLAAHFMSLLAETYGIEAPAAANAQETQHGYMHEC